MSINFTVIGLTQLRIKPKYRPTVPRRTLLPTGVARILQWGGGGGGGENDITFDHTLYTGANPESLDGVDVILNQFKC